MYTELPHCTGKMTEDVVSSFLQLFSHKYGCEGKPRFNPEAALVEARRNKPCTVAGFSHWAAQFGDKINDIMFNAEGSIYIMQIFVVFLLNIMTGVLKRSPWKIVSAN